MPIRDINVEEELKAAEVELNDVETAIRSLQAKKRDLKSLIRMYNHLKGK